MTLDVFLESAGTFDRDAVEAAFAANGIGGDGSTVTTADGGSADVTLEDDSCGFLVEKLTPEVAKIIWDVSRSAGLAILPVDGTPIALVAGEVEVPDELEPERVRTPAQLYEALTRSVSRRNEVRGARTA